MIVVIVVLLLELVTGEVVTEFKVDVREWLVLYVRLVDADVDKEDVEVNVGDPSWKSTDQSSTPYG